MRTLDKFTVQKDSIDTDDETVLFAAVFGNSEIMILAKIERKVENMEINRDSDPQNNISYPCEYKVISSDIAEVDCPHDTDLEKGQFIRLTEQHIKDVNDVLYDEAKPV